MAAANLLHILKIVFEVFLFYVPVTVFILAIWVRLQRIKPGKMGEGEIPGWQEPDQEDADGSSNTASVLREDDASCHARK